MGKPKEIPEDVWDAALHWATSCGQGSRAEVIARAIMAERERCARLIADSEIADSNDGQFVRPRSDGNLAGLAYAAAIRGSA